MLRTLFNVLLVLTAAVSIGGWADRRGLLDSVWRRTLPVETLQPKPDAQARAASMLESRLASLNRDEDELLSQQAKGNEQRSSLGGELAGHLAGRHSEDCDVTSLMAKDPVASALILSIAAEESRAGNVEERLESSRAEVARVQGRLIAVRNGVVEAQSEASSPLAQIGSSKTQGNEEQQQYVRILNEALRQASKGESDGKRRD